jgi:nitrite reductase/ring-hydroxylating ferredoxin subunit
VVLFRDPESGSVVCLDDTCPHRGAPLSKGWLTKEPHSGHTCVVCPYHGWAFDGQGHLNDVPSAEAGKWPKRPLLNTYPVSGPRLAAACLLMHILQHFPVYCLLLAFGCSPVDMCGHLGQLAYLGMKRVVYKAIAAYLPH